MATKEQQCEIRQKKLCEYILYFYLLCLACTWFLQLEISNGNNFSNFKIEYIIFNICSIFVTILILTVISNLFCFSLIFNFVFLILSITNYFVVQMRGTPLSTKDVGNWNTALNVLDSYTFYFGFSFWSILLISGINVFLLYRIYKSIILVKKTRKKNIRQKARVLAISGLFLYVGYFCPNPIQPSKVLGWFWKEAYYQYGYLTVSVDILMQSIHPVNKPATYSIENIEKYKDILKQYHTASSKTQPDIILIINESWYDISQITDYETNIPVMPFIDNLENIQRGYAVVPYIGGGTNCTEYEILTGNSLQLMQGVTPFNVLDLTEATSIISILNRNGYYTASLHPSSSINYNRKNSYAALGINNSYWYEDFDNWEVAGSHWFVSDKSSFNNLINIYENKPDDKPAFLYNLTIQNHGDYLLNSEDENIIKVLDGVDNNEDKQRMEEYLTCLHKTDEAFQWLIEYLGQKERPIIVMMVGDHSPNFISRIVNKEELSEHQKLLYEHSTPFIIWANYELKEMDYGYIGSNYLSALLLDCADVSSSQYFSWMINDLMNDIPIITSFNYYVDKLGNYHSYDETVPGLTEKINMYLDLEYNNISEISQCFR